MRNRMYGGVRGRKTKVGEKLLRFPPTRFYMGGDKLLAYTNFAAGVCEIPMLAYTKSPEKAKASLF